MRLQLMEAAMGGTYRKPSMVSWVLGRCQKAIISSQLLVRRSGRNRALVAPALPQSPGKFSQLGL